MKTKVVHAFPLFDAFRASVDKALEHPYDTETNAPLLYPKAYEELRALVALPSNSDIPPKTELTNDITSDLFEIKKEITLSHLLNCTPLEPYFSVADTLGDALRQTECAPKIDTNDTCWVDAIRVAFSYVKTKKETGSFSFRENHRHTTFAHAIRFFNEKSIPLQVRGDIVEIRATGIVSALAGSITVPLFTLGDTKVMEMLDHAMAQKYDYKIRRLRLHPTPDSMGQKVTRSLPFGLIYRLSLKCLGRRGAKFAPKKTLQHVEESAIHYAALYDVEPFTIYETMFPPKEGHALEILHDVVIFDELFHVPQCHPEVIQRLLDNLFFTVPSDDATTTLGWSVRDAKQLWHLLLKLSCGEFNSTFIKTSTLAELLARSTGKEACEAILKSFVIENPNSKYESPSDAFNSDTRQCALVRASDDRLWIPGKILLAPAFYERLFSTRSAHSTEMSGAFGIAFESYLRSRMTALGINCLHGNILQKKGVRAGDADLIIETEEVIGLLELKKKGISRITNSGNDLSLILDLTQGFIHGVHQLARHEIALIKTGEIRFEDGKILKLNNRRIFKVVISLGDHGGLHDSTVVRNMLESLAGASISTKIPTTPSQIECIDNANSLFKKLGDQFFEFRKIRPSGSNIDLFDNLAFHNIFFIENLLETKRTAKDFLDALQRGTRITTGTRDPFVEHAQFSQY